MSGIMPNVGGSRASKRKVLSSVIHSQLLYAAPVWSEATKSKRLYKLLTRVQRGMSIRVASAYRTISADAAGVIAGIPPIELLARERASKYSGIEKEVARAELLKAWQRKWKTGQHGRWTYRLIPRIEQWIDRPFGEVDYFVTQALSGHGCFKKFLFNRKRADRCECPYCGLTDDAEHTLFRCIKWADSREDFRKATGRTFDVTNFSASLMEGNESWQAVYKTVRHIIENKERDIRSGL